MPAKPKFKEWFDKIPLSAILFTMYLSIDTDNRCTLLSFFVWKSFRCTIRKLSMHGIENDHMRSVEYRLPRIGCHEDSTSALFFYL